MPRRYRNASGPQISRIRNQKGLTQDQLAAQLVFRGLTNMDAMVIAKIEGQHRSVFDYELMVIASVLDVTISDLMPGQIHLEKELGDLVSGEKTT